jgi:hopanoid biosynthesis associated protein HpnK
MPMNPSAASSPPPAASPLGADPRTARRLIVTGDDFGRSSAINQAILHAHRRGILTSASVMVNEAAFDEAVELARSAPTLAVGLHLALSDSLPSSTPDRIPSLLTPEGRFRRSPARAGWKYFFSRAARRELEGEIRAQVQRFLSTGLKPDHVNGHHHLHMHPVIFPILARVCRESGIPAVRIVRERLALSLRSDPGRLLARTSLSAVFALLARNCDPDPGLRTADHVLGLHLDGRMTRDHLLSLLEDLPPGTTEIYSHPSLDAEPGTGRFPLLEYRALISPDVRSAIERLGIRLTSYGDTLPAASDAGAPASSQGSRGA